MRRSILSSSSRSDESRGTSSDHDQIVAVFGKEILPLVRMNVRLKLLIVFIEWRELVKFGVNY